MKHVLIAVMLMAPGVAISQNSVPLKIGDPNAPYMANACIDSRASEIRYSVKAFGRDVRDNSLLVQGENSEVASAILNGQTGAAGPSQRGCVVTSGAALGSSCSCVARPMQ